MKQPEFRPLCSQIFCKATSVSAGNLQARINVRRLVLASETPEILTRHGFFVKKFERALLQAVESNRLRRFGRVHEFFWKLFLLSVRCPNHFFCQNPVAWPAATLLLACSIDAVEFCTYGAASAPP